MKNVFRIIGVAALVVTLICNLQYSFVDVKDNPNAAKASWTYTDPYYLTETIMCGNPPQMDWKAGNWIEMWTNDFCYIPQYCGHWFFFVQDNGGSQCGLNQPSPYGNYMGYEITATAPTYPL